MSEQEVIFEGAVGDYVWVSYDSVNDSKFPGKILEKLNNNKYVVELSINKKKRGELELRKVETLAMQLTHRQNLK